MLVVIFYKYSIAIKHVGKFMLEHIFFTNKCVSIIYNFCQHSPKSHENTFIFGPHSLSYYNLNRTLRSILHKRTAPFRQNCCIIARLHFFFMFCKFLILNFIFITTTIIFSIVVLNILFNKYKSLYFNI